MRACVWVTNTHIKSQAWQYTQIVLELESRDSSTRVELTGQEAPLNGATPGS